MKNTKTKKQSVNELSIPVYNLKGEEVKRISVPKDLYNKKENIKLISQYLHVYHANQRQGTASTKTRSEVSGSTKKIYKQKGTGRARHGARKAPIFVGGGITFGPKPRDFSLKISKKQKRQAFLSALSIQFNKKNVIALENDFLKMKPKTKLFSEWLNKKKIMNERVLLILPKIEHSNILLAANNIPSISFSDVFSLNTYEILRHKKILILEEAFPILQKHFAIN